MKRLDQILVERGLCESREKAQAQILAGNVYSGEQRLEKAGTKIKEDTPLEVKGPACPYVSRAGEKLAAAIELFSVQTEGRTAIDVGASTGGFTDCLLQNGADRVFAVDVGYGQLDAKLRNHPQVVNIERTNARHLTKETLLTFDREAEKIDLVVIDCSFISLRLVVPAIESLLEKNSEWVLLFKPQFEVGKSELKKGGVPKSDEVVDVALQSFKDWMESKGFHLKGGPESSPIAGKKSGNVEFLFHYEKTS